MGPELDLRESESLDFQKKEKKRNLPTAVAHPSIVTSNLENEIIMLWAAMTLAFFGFLRLEELICNSKFNSDIHLTPQDVVFSPGPHPSTSMFIRIKESKTV